MIKHVPALLVALACLSLAAPAGAREPADKASREVKLKELLRSTITDAFRLGDWPERLEAPGITYARPPSECLDDTFAWMTVVLHESLDHDPEGFWIGYADGSTEFAPDARSLDLLLQRSAAYDAARRKPAYTPAELARIARAAALQKRLLELTESAYARGTWPERLPPPGDLLYFRPGPDVSERFIGPATVVLHETPGLYADGVWVGYADGHLEFVPDAHALAGAKAQLPMARTAAAAYRAAAAAATQPANVPLPPARGKLQLKLLGPTPTPLTGVQVGQFGTFGNLFPLSPACFFIEGPNRTDRTLVTGPDGAVSLTAEQIFAVKFTDRDSAPVWLLHSPQRLAALEYLARADLEKGGTREVRLQPVCRVTCRIASTGLHAAGKYVLNGLSEISHVGRERDSTLQCFVVGDRLEYLLPPGDYGVSVRSTGCADAYRFFRIEPGQQEFALYIDLLPDMITRLVNRPAPPLLEIKAWKGQPTTLDALRGKLVLLDFWGYWCGPCIGQMPELFKLHDQFNDRGLIIISIHDDSVASLAEYEEKIAPIRNKNWNGRDIPFRIAFDGGGQRRVPQTSRTARGATTAAYGIQAFPTTLLIGPDGAVLGEFDPADPRAAARIERLLSLPPPSG